MPTRTNDVTRNLLANALKAVGVDAKINPDDEAACYMLVKSCPVTRISVDECGIGDDYDYTLVDCLVPDDRITGHSPKVRAWSSEIRSGPWFRKRVVGAQFKSRADTADRQLADHLNEDVQIRSLLSAKFIHLNVGTDPGERGWSIDLYGYLDDLEPDILSSHRDLVLAVARRLLEIPSTTMDSWS